MIESLRIRLRSDVPIAFCLSSGIGSSLLAAITKKKLEQDISTFTLIDNDLRYSEKNVDLICNHLNCKNIQINISDYKNFIKNLKELNVMNTLSSQLISYYIQSILTKQISKKGFKVLSGIGADEIFQIHEYFYLLFH